jgi:hypothetical protein
MDFDPGRGFSFAEEAKHLEKCCDSREFLQSCVSVARYTGFSVIHCQCQRTKGEVSLEFGTTVQVPLENFRQLTQNARILENRKTSPKSVSWRLSIYPRCIHFPSSYSETEISHGSEDEPRWTQEHEGRRAHRIVREQFDRAVLECRPRKRREHLVQGGDDNAPSVCRIVPRNRSGATSSGDNPRRGFAGSPRFISSRTSPLGNTQ